VHSSTTGNLAGANHRSVRSVYLSFTVALPFWLATIWVLNGVVA
jgi:hypothetical protein